MITALAPVNGEAILPLADARAHLNYGAGETEHDERIRSMRAEAIGLMEEHSRRSLQSRQFRWEVDRFTANMRLPMRPAQSVDEIAYADRNGVSASLLQANWRYAGGFLNPATGYYWPLTGTARASVRITFTAGYATAAEIPPPLIWAVKLAMAAMDDDRANPDLSAALRIANRFKRRVL